MLGFLACLWLGTVGKIDGAANVALLWVWIGFVSGFVALSDDAVRAYQAKGPPPAPDWIDVPLDVAAIVLMAWHGWMWSAAAYTVHVLLLLRLRRPLPSDSAAPAGSVPHGEVG